ncbi:MAG: hypothetical protein V5A25_02450 [Halovenus sp.]
MAGFSELVERSLTDEAADTFTDRVEAQAASLTRAIEAGELDNEDFAIGMELEVYAVDSDGFQLAALPDTVFDGPAAKELGVHNAELNTDPDVFDGVGLAAQRTALAEDLAAAREDARAVGLELVLDSMWTVPPRDGSDDYLTATTERDGLTLPRHMRQDPRYAAIDSEVLAHGGGSISFSVPGLAREFPSILFESLATSIQPHLQIPSAATFPAYYNTAIRTLGPVLALGTNSPLLPPDLYGDVDPEALLAETHHELRIAVFEQSVNTSPNPKVRVPADIDDATDVVDDVVADDLFAPFLREWLGNGERESFADRYWEFDYKRTTYWRWLRCVIGGDPVEGAGDERSLRIEYRPIPTQPTVTDIVGMQALVGGLVCGLVAADHPLTELPWGAARDSFYAAARDGLDADLAWVTEDGERTTESDRIFSEVFEYARRGLEAAGVPEDSRGQYLRPLEMRWERRTTPSQWKLRTVREELRSGASFPAAVERMQRHYHELSREHESFAAWL